MNILPTDTLFLDYADTGDPDCLCSRCGLVIEEGCVPIRCWRESEPDFAYRYHPHCLGMEPCCDDEEDGE